MGNDKRVKTEVPTMRKRLSAMKSSPLDMVLSPAYIALNYGLGLFGADLLQHQMDTSIDRFHSPKARAKILKENVKGIKTSYLNEPIKKANQSITTNLVNTLTRTTTGFESLLQAIDPMLLDPAHGPRALQKQNLLTNTQTRLGPTRGLNEELNLFTLRMKTLQQLLDKNEVDDPRVISAYVKDEYDRMLKQLKLKKTADLTAIDTEIANLRVRNAELGVPLLTDHEINTLAATLKKEIDEAHEKAEKALDKDVKTGTPPDKKDEADKGTPALLTEFDKAVNQAEAELTNFVLFAEKSKSKTLVESEDLTARLGIGGAHQGEKYRDASFLDYANSLPDRDHSWVSPTAWFQYAQFLMNNRGELSTPSGLRVSYSDGNINFSFPPHNAVYYHYQDRLLGADLMIMVKDMVKNGFSSVTLTLECDNPELRKKIMEEFYYCAHLCGFPDDKIMFKIGECRRSRDEEEKKPIDNKKASEIMGKLGRAPKRAQAKKAQWDQEQAVLDKSNKVDCQRAVAELDERIDNIIGQDEPAIHAVGRYI